MNLVNICLISNITLKPYFQAALQEIAPLYKLDTEIAAIDYYETVSGCWDVLDIKKAADYIVVCLNFERLFPSSVNDILSGYMSRQAYQNRSINLCEELYHYLKENFQIPILWFGFEDCYCLYPRIKGMSPVNAMLVDRINLVLYEMLRDGDVYLDLKRLIAEEGISNTYDNRGKYCWNIPYSVSLTKRMCREIIRQCKSRQGSGRMKKCIVLDCDNVLWGGILAEDGIEGLQLGMAGNGQKYWEFQQLLLYLFYHGIILTVCSKNNPEEVLQVFREHSGMLLKEENIACFQTGWERKVVSVRNIAQTLNIGVDSMIFIDDSLYEIREMQTELPEVESIWYGHDDLYEKLSCIYLGNADIETAGRRTDFYRKEKLRKAMGMDSSSPAEYAKKLEMKTEIHEVLPLEFSRIAELTQRTNKCTNGKRYTLVELKRQLEVSGYKIYSVAVSDIYSDLGIVGVMGTDGDVLDLFSLSCRAFGRGLEEKMLDYVKKLGIKRFTFSDTGKNIEILHLLEAAGKLQQVK